MAISRWMSTVILIEIHPKYKNLLRQSDSYTRNRAKSGKVLLNSTIRFLRKGGITEHRRFHKSTIIMNTIQKWHGRMVANIQSYTGGLSQMLISNN